MLSLVRGVGEAVSIESSRGTPLCPLSPKACTPSSCVQTGKGIVADLPAVVLHSLVAQPHLSRPPDAGLAAPPQESSQGMQTAGALPSSPSGTYSFY